MKKRKSSSGASDVEYNASDVGSDEGGSAPGTGTASLPSDDEMSQSRKKRTRTQDSHLSLVSSNSVPTAPAPEIPRPGYEPALVINDQRGYTPNELDEERSCGLCKCTHGPGLCIMTQNPSNLVDYRLMLISESREPIEARRIAIQAIDANLASRGLFHLTSGQPRILPFRGGPDLSHKAHTSKLDGTLKRHTPSSDSSSSKKTKRVDPMAIPCVICGGPLHLARVCPVVKAGPERFVYVSIKSHRFMTLSILQYQTGHSTPIRRPIIDTYCQHPDCIPSTHTQPAAIFWWASCIGTRQARVILKGTIECIAVCYICNLCRIHFLPSSIYYKRSNRRAISCQLHDYN
jgi:hypothetical protein